MGEIDDIIKKISPFYKKKDKPSEEYELSYDSTSETLEPIYFWILDFMNRSFKTVEKLIDNFASSPGSGHFSELQGKASQMQQEASRVLGTVNNILKGVLNLIYDLKEFKIRLSHYDAANSSDKIKKEAGMLALKQIWMDKVDIQRGQGSLNALASGNLQFVTIRDAFMIVNKPEEVDKLDLNDRVKRILKPRLQEFLEWKTRSEQELRKRFELERLYLKSQVDALKLNSKWAKPYLRAAQQLTSSEKLASDAALVTAFNTVLLQLSIMGYKKLDIIEEATEPKEGHLPEEFKKRNILRKIRPTYTVVIVDFKFRGIPSRTGTHYVFGGRADVNFRAYALNQDEIDLLHKKLKESDLEDSLRLVQGMTDDSLEELKVDIDELLGDEKEKKKQENNPFTSLFSFFKKEKKETKDKEKEKIDKLNKKGIKKDNYYESYARNVAEANAINACFRVYDIYKKSAGMASLPYLEDKEPKTPVSAADKFFGFK